MQEGKWGGSSPEGREKEELGPVLRAFGVGGMRKDAARLQLEQGGEEKIKKEYSASG